MRPGAVLSPKSKNAEALWDRLFERSGLICSQAKNKAGSFVIEPWSRYEPGEAGAAGEFGHMTIGMGAPVACAAGSRECWEAFSSERAALARYAHLSQTSNGSNSISCDQLIDLALNDDETACTALRETARYLGIGISNLIQGLAPEAVIVGGPIVRAWSVIAEDVKNAAESGICRGLPSTPIIASTLRPLPTLMGAISLVLASKFAQVSVT